MAGPGIGTAHALDVNAALGSGNPYGVNVGPGSGPVAPTPTGPGWNLVPSLNVQELYDDNIALAASGQERSDFVTEVNPAISISKASRRLNLLANYQMQNIFYAKNSSSNATFHQLFSTLDADLWPGTFALGAEATASQALISPTDPVPLSNVSISGNRTNVLTYSATPRFQHSFGQMAIVRAHYSYSVVDYNTQQLSGSQTSEEGTSIETGPDVPGLGLRLSYNHSRTNFDGSQDVIFERVLGEARYPVQSKFRLVVRGGYENNNFQFGPTVQQPKGKIWSGGFQWDITPRSYLEASYGRRFFGRTIEASFRNEGAWTSASVNYSEEPSTISSLALELQPLIAGPNGQVTQVLAPSLPGLSAEVFINRQLSVTLGAHGLRDRVSATVSRSERTYEFTGSKETVTGVDASWNRNLGVRTSAEVSGYWQRWQFVDGVRVDNLWEASGALIYQLGRYANTSLSVTHLQRNSNASADYSVNMVSLGVTVEF
ncbi:MAG TPA: TIGR03016 family PEP-CTERM system-associated outer membrane protein [Gammaproteobacteria bacterium]|nr:TIGR03016 family PEP-CTERM system-associated outer membrane protein [Gammaproteobacteria bacterium]